jgi:hypothetical protein
VENLCHLATKKKAGIATHKKEFFWKKKIQICHISRKNKG